jgi:hypothetical protein
VARGKHQASKTAQQLRSAETRITELEAVLASERSAAHDREQELLGEVQRLENEAVTETTERVQRQLEFERERHRARIAELEQEFERRVYVILTTIGYAVETSRNIKLNADLWNTLCTASKLSMGEVLQLLDPRKEGLNNRRVRRATKADVNALFKANSGG